MKGVTRRAAWDYPECPSCETDVFVDKTASNRDTFRCNFCGERFEGEDPRAE